MLVSYIQIGSLRQGKGIFKINKKGTHLMSLKSYDGRISKDCNEDLRLKHYVCTWDLKWSQQFHQTFRECVKYFIKDQLTSGIILEKQTKKFHLM